MHDFTFRSKLYPRSCVFLIMLDLNKSPNGVGEIIKHGTIINRGGWIFPCPIPMLGCFVRTKSWSSICCFSPQLNLGPNISKTKFRNLLTPASYPPKPLKLAVVFEIYGPRVNCGEKQQIELQLFVLTKHPNPCIYVSYFFNLNENEQLVIKETDKMVSP